MNLLFDFFSYTVLCSDLEWTYTVTLSGGAALPSFITYDGQVALTNVGQIVVDTNLTSDIADYNVVITGSVPNG